MNGTPVSYAGNSLQSTFVFSANIRHESVGTKLAIPYTIAHGNGSVIPFSEYSSKMISIEGTVTGNGVADLDSKLDTFRSYFNKDGQNLDIGYASGTRRYIATMTDLQIDRPGGLAFAHFTVTFMCLNAFGQDVSSTTLVSATGLTVATRTDNVTILGSAPQQLCVATITLTAFTGSGSQTMNFGNNNNGQQITVTRSTWTAGDIIQIDSSKYSVTVNGTPIDFTGAFIELPPGAQSLGYSDSFTTRTFNYNVVYYPRWF